MTYLTQKLSKARLTKVERRGELNRPLDSPPATEKVLDFPAESKSFNDFPEGREDGPKTASKDPNNHGKPDRSVRLKGTVETNRCENRRSIAFRAGHVIDLQNPARAKFV
jgi:hypothetical protein